jgi:hypothetical protein
MSNMLTWLAARGSQAALFPQSARDGTAFRLGFSSEAEALAFVCAFGGRLIRPEPDASVGFRGAAEAVLAKKPLGRA